MQYLDPATGLLWAMPSTTVTYFNATEGICYYPVHSVDMLLYYNWQDGSAGSLSKVNKQLGVS